MIIHARLVKKAPAGFWCGSPRKGVTVSDRIACGFTVFDARGDYASPGHDAARVGGKTQRGRKEVTCPECLAALDQLVTNRSEGNS